ncbi:GyrI-like domain-containing protein [Streptomyces sp. NPDC047315]|uniref:GyrI-like domain-containing protein n=1 Tax=Streptomyces sp. NPDC047315 TaxID=3155142 RepID=UPI0033E93C4D
MSDDSRNDTDSGTNGASGARDAGWVLRPTLSVQPEQPYAFIRGSVRMDNFAVIADRLGELIGWLSAQGAEFAGAPFFRFNTVDMAGESDVEAGVPVVVAPPATEGDIQTGALPAGHYATVRHTGHPDQLFAVITALRAWADEEGLTWDMTPLEGGAERWGCRLESYLTDPAVEPDMDKWEIELSFRLADTG